jgi:hypothetical protein
MAEYTFKEFKRDMEWGVNNFSYEATEEIWESVNSEFSTREDLDNSEYYHEGDFTLFTDSGLHSLVENLNEFNEEEIISMMRAQYGRIVEFLYLTEDEVFVMAYGAR